jgi:hypothetical protein
MALNLKQVEQHAKEYVEMEARTKVLSVRFFKRYTLFGREDVVLFVRTTDKKDPDWWVIGGSTPMNLYSTRMFPGTGHCVLASSWPDVADGRS